MERIARAVIRRDDRLLVARERTQTYSFLPGGHIEPGERAEEALVRELAEELGVDATVGRYIGELESSYVDARGRNRHEVNFVFETSIGASDAVSQEDRLEFHWLPLDALADADLRPAEIKRLAWPQ